VPRHSVLHNGLLSCDVEMLAFEIIESGLEYY